MARTSSPKRAKSAARIEGAIFMPPAMKYALSRAALVLGRPGHHALQRLASPADFVFAQGRMDKEHQTFFAERLGDGQPLLGTKAGVEEGLLEVDFRARPRIARRALRFDRRDDTVPRPAIDERARTNEHIGFIGRVFEALGRRRRAQALDLRRGAPNPLRIFDPCAAP